MYFFYPETAGRSLEEIDAIFVESKSIFDTVQVARRVPRAHFTDLTRGEKVADPELFELAGEKEV